MNVEIPKANEEYDNYPCWIPVRRCTNYKERQQARENGNPVPEEIFEKVKPLIKCQCGVVTGIGLHHVYPDGKVMASYFHTKSGEHGHPNGCEWHVFLTLLDWTGEEYPPQK